MLNHAEPPQRMHLSSVDSPLSETHRHFIIMCGARPCASNCMHTHPKHLKAKIWVGMREGDTNIEQIIDRMMFRPRENNPTGESWHRDVATNMEDGDIVFGGWINLNKYDHYFSCVLGTHNDEGSLTTKGFAEISRQDALVYKTHKKRKKVRIPPGHLMIFNERLVHEVLASTKKKSAPVIRLFTSWRLTKSTTPLIPDLRTKLNDCDVMPLKSGQVPRMYAKLHPVNWTEQCVKLPDDWDPMTARELGLWKAKRKVPETDGLAAHMKPQCLEVITQKGSVKAFSGLTLTIVRTILPSLKEMGMLDRSKYPPYFDREIYMYTPHNTTIYPPGAPPAASAAPRAASVTQLPNVKMIRIGKTHERGGSSTGTAIDLTREPPTVLLPIHTKWWRAFRRNGKDPPSNVDDRIETGEMQPTRDMETFDNPPTRVPAIWKQWVSAAITFCDVAESDPSATETGTATREPLSVQDCKNIAQKVARSKVYRINLPGEREACVVYLPQFFNTHDLDGELRRINPAFIDRHMRTRGGKILHKNARWNTNITDNLRWRDPQLYTAAAAAAAGRRTSLHSSEVPFDLPLPAFLEARDKITTLGKDALGGNTKLDKLVCEINFYFDSGGIGFHGDKERHIVFGGSVGGSVRYIDWCSFQKFKPVMRDGKVIVSRLTLFPGDAYIMSGVATGNDWNKSKIVTIRHCAGDREFLTKYKVNDPEVDKRKVCYSNPPRGDERFTINVLNETHRHAPCYDRHGNVVKGPGSESLEIVSIHDPRNPTTLSDDEAAMDDYRGRVDDPTTSSDDEGASMFQPFNLHF